MLVFKCHVSEYVYIVFLKIQLRAERNHFVQTPTNEKKLQLMEKRNEYSMLSHVFHQKHIKLFTFPQKLFTECPCSNIE